MAKYKQIVVPTDGAAITIKNKRLAVPNNPIIPVIEGDGIGRDIMKATRRVVDAAVAKAYAGNRRICWMDVYAGEKANEMYGEWLPKETFTAIKTYLVALKGPLTTPVGGGFRSPQLPDRIEPGCCRSDASSIPVRSQWARRVSAVTAKPRRRTYRESAVGM